MSASPFEFGRRNLLTRLNGRWGAEVAAAERSSVSARTIMNDAAMAIQAFRCEKLSNIDRRLLLPDPGLPGTTQPWRRRRVAKESGRSCPQRQAASSVDRAPAPDSQRPDVPALAQENATDEQSDA